MVQFLLYKLQMRQICAGLRLQVTNRSQLLPITKSLGDVSGNRRIIRVGQKSKKIVSRVEHRKVRQKCHDIY